MNRTFAASLVIAMSLAASACADTLKSTAHLALVTIKANECDGLPMPEQKQCISKANVSHEESQDQLEAFRREQAEERAGTQIPEADRL